MRDVPRREFPPLGPLAVKFSPARRLGHVHEAALIRMQDKTHPPFHKLPPQARRGSVCHPPLKRGRGKNKNVLPFASEPLVFTSQETSRYNYVSKSEVPIEVRAAEWNALFSARAA